MSSVQNTSFDCNIRYKEMDAKKKAQLEANRNGLKKQLFDIVSHQRALKGRCTHKTSSSYDAQAMLNEFF